MTDNRGIKSKFALVGQKGVGPGEEEVGGSPSSPTPLTAMPGTSSRTLLTCRGGKTQNRLVALPSRVRRGLGQRPQRKRGLGAFPRKSCENYKQNLAFWAHLALFHIKLCFHCFVRRGRATPNYTRSMRYTMAQVSGTHGQWHTCTKL